MKRIAINVLAVILGLVVGSLVNMGLVVLGPLLIPVPAGVDVTDIESLAGSMHLFETRHFLFPFLAHALGTLVGAWVAYCFASGHLKWRAWVVGLIFLIGGVANAFMIPAPLWFVVSDLVVAYVPTAWLAIVIGQKLKSTTSTI